MAITDNIVSAWHLDEASGNALDAFSTNDLTANNVPLAGTGKINGDRLFVSATSQTFIHATSTDFEMADNTVSYTFTCWVNLTSASGTQQIITKRINGGVGNNLAYMVRTDSGTPTVYWGIVTGNTFGSLAWGSALTAGTWYFLCFGYDASTNKFFLSVNSGSRVLSSSVTDQTTKANGNDIAPFFFGGTNTEFLGGAMDEVGFWKRAITTGEESTLYNSGTGLAYPYSGGGGTTFQSYYYRLLAA